MRVISCNIRASSMPEDNIANLWKNRSERCIQSVLECDPDLIALQECQNDQLADFKEALGSNWDSFWMQSTPLAWMLPENALFFRKDKFTPCNYGGYFLSETPHIPGSSSWGSECVRLANFVVLEDCCGKKIRFVNTHIDHASQLAREKQTQMLIEESNYWPLELPQIIAGDFNCDVNNPAIQMFLTNDWRDSFYEATDIAEPGFTYHGFLGRKWNGDNGECGNGKMDWIFIKGTVRCTSSSIITNSANGFYPSDHYFVLADLEL